MSHSFFSFSPESFEQFVRTLSLQVFGPGVTAFGNGPDGGREATFHGQVPYPFPPATQWSGYGVIQAKYKEKAETAEKDQTWALKLLEKELSGFAESERRGPKPDYYVFVTNVELSSTVGGGRDKADELIRSFEEGLALKAHAVWDANQLSTFLAAYGELRRRFAAYLTTGDVLATMTEHIARRTPNATLILTAFLERELRADQSARLDQAGNRTEDQLKLASLFFDLPASADLQLAPPVEHRDATGRLPHGVLWELLRAGACKLDPETVFEQETSAPESTTARLPARFVLLGGPGSGKSTLGQFLAQIHRAALLGRCRQQLLQPETRVVIEETRILCEREDLPWPATPRYPVRIELGRFGKALVSKEPEGTTRLGDYILHEVRHGYQMSYEDMMEWLSAHPWLLILDGLDEVPTSSNRAALVEAVKDFLAEARQVGADLFVVATSRHQGYGGEFSEGAVAFRHLLPLSTPRALRYVERYAEARFGSTDPRRAADLLEKLRASAVRELTNQLMMSPLQVTFMATVVAARGDPGEDRWQLFESYYRTIYDRERQKAVPPYDAVLSKQQPTIDRLHNDVGFWLQQKAEKAGTSSASLPIFRFEALVETYLAELGREGRERENLVKLITDAARNRLVFLTSRVPGELSFDVRSLQEFMASECLTTGRPEEVRSRLRTIAGSSYWRNVFLFAASKCFADARSRHLQDTIRALCEELNSSRDPLLVATQAGSELALDILQSGAVEENPHHGRQLARIALDLLEQPYLTAEHQNQVPAIQRLSAAYRRERSTVYREELELRLRRADLRQTFGAWPLLFRLADSGVDWAVAASQSYWPKDPRGQSTLLTHLSRDISGSGTFLDRLREILPALPPARARAIVSGESRTDLSINDNDKFVQALSRFCGPPVGEVRIPLHVLDDRSGAFGLGLVPVGTSANRPGPRASLRPDKLRFSHPGWLPLLLADAFLTSPSADSLADVLEVCADGGWSSAAETPLRSLPWPLSSCLSRVGSSEGLRRLARSIRAGAMGDLKDWEAAENAWFSQGFKLRSYSAAAEEQERALLLDDIPLVPPPLSWWYTSGSHADPVLEELFLAAQGTHSDEVRNMALWFLCCASRSTGGITRCVKPSDLQEQLQRAPERFSWYDNCVGFPKDRAAELSWLRFFEWLGRSALITEYGSFGLNQHDLAWRPSLEAAFIDAGVGSIPFFSSRRAAARRPLGLLRMLGRLAASGHQIESIPPRLLKRGSLCEPRFELAAVLVRMTQSSLTADGAKRLAKECLPLLDPPAEPGADTLVWRTAERNLHRVSGIEHFLVQLHSRMPSRVELGAANCQRILRRAAADRPSALHSPGTLRRLGLPIVAAR